MASSMGRHLVLTTFGESASRYVGAVIDGLPAGLPLSPEDIRFELGFRKPGRKLVSGRREEDIPEIVSGLYNGYTTGSPVTVIVKNSDPQPLLYQDVSHLPRPGHADLSFIKKYGRENWDYVGGGRSSARETLSRVIGGTVAKKLLMIAGTQVAAYLKSIGGAGDQDTVTFSDAMGSKHYPTRARNRERDTEFSEIISRLFSEGDSAGGIVEIMASGVLPGMGDPVFWKIKSAMASALMSMPAATGFEYGLGFRSAAMKGSEASDSIVKDSSGHLHTEKNLSGGILGGITTGSDLTVRCAFKPTSSIRKPALTVDLDTMESGSISVIGRHDPVVAVRGVAVAEAMVAVVLADYYLYEGVLPSSRIPRTAATEMEEKWKAYMKEYAQ